MPSWSTPAYRPTRNFWLDSFYYADVSGLPTTADSSTVITNTANFHTNRQGGPYLQMITFGTDNWEGGFQAGYFIDGTTSTATTNWTIPPADPDGPSTPNPQPWNANLRQENAFKDFFGNYTPYVYTGFNEETDRHAVLYSPGKLTEAYHYNGSSAAADIVATYDLTSTTLPTSGGNAVGVVAAKIPVAPFAFTYADLVDNLGGDLGHMLGWVAANYRGAQEWPARGTDGGLGAGYLKAGQVMRLKSTYNVDALSNNYIKVIARTLKKYGVMLYDKNTTNTSPTGTPGRATLFCPSDPDWPTGLSTDLGNIAATAFPLSEFEVVDLSSIAGTANSIAVVTSSNVPPTASFTADPTTGVTPISVDFTDTSTDGDGTIVSWFWDFGNGLTSTDQNPTTGYFEGGSYPVLLTVTDDDGASDSYLQTLTFDGAVGPTAVITLTPGSTGTVPFTFTFSDSESEPGTSPFSEPSQWTFEGVTGEPGDPGTFNSLTGEVTYTVAGTYTVLLFVQTEVGTDFASVDVVVTDPEGPEPPVPSFTYTPATGTAPLTVTLTDTSTGGPWATRLFDWATGSGSSGEQVVTYEVPGTYTVTLTLTDAEDVEYSVSHDIVVTEVPPPTITCTVTPLYPNGNTAPVVVAASVSVDPPETVAESAVIDWGDGSVPELVLAPLEADIPHTYSTSGIYQVLVDLYESPDGPNG